MATQNQDGGKEQVMQAVNKEQPKKKKKYHSSALYAASKWHGTVNYVKAPNAGHKMLPTQL